MCVPISNTKSANTANTFGMASSKFCRCLSYFHLNILMQVQKKWLQFCFVTNMARRCHVTKYRREPFVLFNSSRFVQQVKMLMPFFRDLQGMYVLSEWFCSTLVINNWSSIVNFFLGLYGSGSWRRNTCNKSNGRQLISALSKLPSLPIIKS